MTNNIENENEHENANADADASLDSMEGASSAAPRTTRMKPMRSSSKIPGEPIDTWLSKKGASPDDGEKVTNAHLTSGAESYLKSRVEGYEKGVKLISEIINSKEEISLTAERTGATEEQIIAMLAAKRVNILHRIACYKSVLAPSIGLTLSIDYKGKTYIFE